MKRSLAVLLVLGLAASFAVAPAQAKKKKKPVRAERVVEVDYQLGGLGVSTPAATAGTCFVDPTQPASCKDVALMKGESYIKIEIQDASGTTVPGSMNQGDIDGDGVNDIYGQFCGAMPEPIQLQDSYAPVSISMYPGVCADASSGGIPTTGTIVVTLSNMP